MPRATDSVLARTQPALNEQSSFPAFAAAPPQQRIERAPHPVATGILLTLLFLLMSRMVEFVGAVVNVNLRLAAILIALSVLGALLSGALTAAFRTPIVLMFSALTCWLLLTTATSQWKGGSVGMLVSVWASTFACAILVPSLISTVDQCKKALYIAGIGLPPMVLATFIFHSQVQGRDQAAWGTLGNPNDLAFSILFLVPFAAFIIRSESFFNWKTLVCVAAIGAAFVTVLRTGSRAGMLTCVVLFAIIFLAGQAKTKFKLLVVLGLLTAASLAFVPNSTLLRYLTVFNGTSKDADMSIDQVSAVESTQARKMLFMESVRLMFEHPVFGVGPGIFSAALAGEQEKRGEHQSWFEAHNSFTQMGSEAGIPAFLLFVSMVLYCLKRSISLYRSTRGDPKKIEIHRMSASLALSLVVFIICAAFGNYAYTFHFAALAGLVQALDVAVRRQGATQPAGIPLTGTPPFLGSPDLGPVMLPPAFAARTARPVGQVTSTQAPSVRVRSSQISSRYVRNRRIRDPRA